MIQFKAKTTSNPKQSKPKVNLLVGFCGIGGEWQGIKEIDGISGDVFINHDDNAILSHSLNHPYGKHLNEDIVKVNIPGLPKVFMGWFSPDCTHFSKAKGGQSRKEDSRMLAWQIPKYAQALGMNVVFLENVEDFLTWDVLIQKIKVRKILNKDLRRFLANLRKEGGKEVLKQERFRHHTLVTVGYLNKDGSKFMVPKTDKNKLGGEFKRWMAYMKSIGFVNIEYKVLNASDYGAHQRRKRVYLVATKEEYPIKWPLQTHSESGLSPYLPWNPVRDILDLEDQGLSVFHDPKKKNKKGGEKAFRDVKLKDKTLQKVFLGVLKFGAGVDGDKHPAKRRKKLFETILDEPQKVHEIIMSYQKKRTLEDNYILEYNGDGNYNSLRRPLGTVTTKERFAKVFIHSQYGNGENNRSIDTTLATITTNPKHLVVATQFAATDKSEHSQGLLTSQAYIEQLMKASKLELLNTDSVGEKKLKVLCAMIGAIDIRMRMLSLVELLLAQGFPPDYKIVGTETDKKKYIGNAVIPLMAFLLVGTAYKHWQKLGLV